MRVQARLMITLYHLLFKYRTSSAPMLAKSAWPSDLQGTIMKELAEVSSRQQLLVCIIVLHDGANVRVPLGDRQREFSLHLMHQRCALWNGDPPTKATRNARAAETPAQRSFAAVPPSQSSVYRKCLTAPTSMLS